MSIQRHDGAWPERPKVGRLDQRVTIDYDPYGGLVMPFTTPCASFADL